MKVAGLEGALLDAAVALAEDRTPDLRLAGWRLESFVPSTNWQQGGPIIERERIWLAFEKDDGEGGSGWVATWGASVEDHLHATGPTPLIAAMRAFVVSKFGDEIALP